MNTFETQLIDLNEIRVINDTPIFKNSLNKINVERSKTRLTENFRALPVPDINVMAK